MCRFKEEKNKLAIELIHATLDMTSFNLIGINPIDSNLAKRIIDSFNLKWKVIYESENGRKHTFKPNYLSEKRKYYFLIDENKNYKLLII